MTVGDKTSSLFQGDKVGDGRHCPQTVFCAQVRKLILKSADGR